MNKIYEFVKKIPKGKVSTYKIVAERCGLKNRWRYVGRVLSENYDKKIPCHRVVNSNGFVGGYNRGIKKKVDILRKEGIDIKNNRIVNVKNYLYK